MTPIRKGLEESETLEDAIDFLRKLHTKEKDEIEDYKRVKEK